MTEAVIWNEMKTYRQQVCSERSLPFCTKALLLDALQEGGGFVDLITLESQTLLWDTRVR